MASGASRVSCVAVLVVLATASCTTESDAPLQIRLESANASYVEERPTGGDWDEGLSPWPEVEARFLVDGKAIGTCSKRWFHFEVTCRLGVDVELRDDSRIELVVEDRDGSTSERMGAGRLEDLRSKLPQRGQATLELLPYGSVTAASVTLEAKWVPILPMTAAFLLLGLGGVALAFVAYGFLRRRFLTHEDRYRRSVAMITATVATIFGCGSLLPVLANTKANTLEPLLLAVPTGLGAYALSALIIDGIAGRRWGRQRATIATGALLALLAVPAIVGFAAISIKLKIIAIVVVAILVLFL